jgi:hypothetical protein
MIERGERKRTALRTVQRLRHFSRIGSSNTYAADFRRASRRCFDMNTDINANHAGKGIGRLSRSPSSEM